MAYESVIAEAATGRMRGVSERGALTFKGVPYGAPLHGRRFQPPRPVESWDGVRSCLFWGPIAPQQTLAQQRLGLVGDEDAFLLYRGSDAVAQSEDCLRLNVWTPDLSGSRPVLVFLHGGGFAGGSGNDLRAYDGANLAATENCVVLTGNHRLNAFGFLDLSWAQGFEDSANLGMQDLVLLLEWVRDNISRFGGDPENVTIYGQSGGGGKVTALMSMPSAVGLFHRAIIQSGSFTSLNDPDDGRRHTEELLCDQHWTLDELVNRPMEELMGAAARFRMTAWKPVLDGHVLAEPLLGDPAAPASPMSASIPTMIGSCQNEFVNGLDDARVEDFGEEDLQRELEALHGAGSRAIIAGFRDVYPGESPFGLYATIAAAPVRGSVVQQLDAKVAQGGSAWGYRFAWRTPVLDGRPGTFHTAEVAFVQKNTDLCPRQTGGGSDARRLGEIMGGAWAAFARTGVPGPVGDETWRTWGPDRPTATFDDAPRCIDRLDDVALSAVGNPRWIY